MCYKIPDFKLPNVQSLSQFHKKSRHMLIIIDWFLSVEFIKKKFLAVLSHFLDVFIILYPEHIILLAVNYSLESAKFY